MTTLADIRATIADELRRTDLNDQIDRSIIRACEYIARECSFITERAECEIATIAGQQWYSTVDMSSSAGPGTNDSATLDAGEVLNILHMQRLDTSSLYQEITERAFKTFERLSEDTASGGPPVHYSMYGGRIGFWPVPQSVITIEFSGYIKPVIPSTGTDECVFFDEAQELVERLASQRVNRHYIRDFEAAQADSMTAGEIIAGLRHENAKKQSAGRITSRGI